MLLGGAEGAFLGVVVTLFVVSLAPQTRGPIFASTSGRVVKTVMATLGPVLPSEAREELAPFLSPGDTAVAKDDAVPTLPSLDAIAPSPATRDTATKPASLGDLIDEGEKKIGKAITDKATQEFQQATGGNSNGRTIERR
jgi:membrane protein required for colicin V production